MKKCFLAFTLIISLFTASFAMASSETNEKQIQILKEFLKQAESLQGVDAHGIACQVNVDSNSIALLQGDHATVSVATDDYEFAVHQTEKTLDFGAPTCDGHSEVHAVIDPSRGQLSIQVIEEFRGFENGDICILNLKK